ncbi:MAG TPA: hypothetical protein VFZ78_04080, partial [Flavisolibacter sp.]
ASVPGESYGAAPVARRIGIMTEKESPPSHFVLWRISADSVCEKIRDCGLRPPKPAALAS